MLANEPIENGAIFKQDAMKLQDKYMPVYQVITSESIHIAAPVATVYPLIERLDFSKSKIVYWLFKLRGIPVPASMNLAGLQQLNFMLLEVIPNKEMLIGIVGKFWTPDGKLKRTRATEFLAVSDKAYAKGGWSFELVALSERLTQVVTETRVFCPDEKALRRFKFYWFFIKPFSRLIRREMLKCLRKQAKENAAVYLARQ